MNIWTPVRRPGARVPVLFWIHTGGFRGASSNFAASNGQRFAEEKGVIIVAPNYRFGPFGFLAHSALTTEDAGYRSSGNYGLADQRAALIWVRQNIAAFGGDPDNVTTAGTSAGGQSVSLHVVSPPSRGLFHRAIIQSGPPSYRWRTAFEAEAQGDAFAAALGCSDRATVLTCLRSKTRDQVLQALPLFGDEFVERPQVQWGPVVDGLEIPAQPRELYQRGEFYRVPIIIGVTRDEGWNWVDRSFPSGLNEAQYEMAVFNEFGAEAPAALRLYPVSAFPSPKDALARMTGDVEYACEARRVARFVHRAGLPVYVYSFEYDIDDVSPGRAIHGTESNLLFGNDFAPPTAHALNAADLALFSTMSGFWRRFAETGNPNEPGNAVEWPPFVHDPTRTSDSDRYLVLDSTVGPASYLRDEQCNFWEHHFLRSVTGTTPAASR